MIQAAAPAVMMTDMDKDWDHDLFGCTDDIGHCCLACCCPCLSVQSTRDILEPDSGSNWCCLCLFCQCCTCGTVLALQRQAVRQRRGIGGNFCLDCCVGMLCYPCSLTQSYLEIRDEMTFNGGGLAGAGPGMMMPQNSGMPIMNGGGGMYPPNSIQSQSSYTPMSQMMVQQQPSMMMQPQMMNGGNMGYQQQQQQQQPYGKMY